MWYDGSHGSWVEEDGCRDYDIWVEVRKGDCVWRGRYWESCCDYKSDIQDINCGHDRISWDSILGAKKYQLEFDFDAKNFQCRPAQVDSFSKIKWVSPYPRWSVPDHYPSFFYEGESRVLCRYR